MLSNMVEFIRDVCTSALGPSASFGWAFPMLCFQWVWVAPGLFFELFWWKSSCFSRIWHSCCEQEHSWWKSSCFCRNWRSCIAGTSHAMALWWGAWGNDGRCLWIFVRLLRAQKRKLHVLCREAPITLKMHPFSVFVIGPAGVVTPCWLSALSGQSNIRSIFARRRMLLKAWCHCWSVNLRGPKNETAFCAALRLPKYGPQVCVCVCRSPLLSICLGRSFWRPSHACRNIWAGECDH